ncbi:hypothetical protein [Gorillibacterium sp. sgz500922]|uniref:hypothetical protein n=1 Tax=Gorillibacterium sp. sgz500922 TaxID=3446694 RepID=UPI003F6782E7
MDKFVLEAEPFNGIWLNCVNNNLISMMLNVDPSFKEIMFYMQVKYFKCKFDQEFASDEAKVRMVAEGNMTPYVNYFSDMMYQFFDYKKESFKSNDFSGLQDCLKAAIREGSYVFLEIDRFFYPNGREAGNFHMVHPVFIHGYNDREEVFYAIEDCLNPGVMEHYVLPYSSVKQSLEYFIGQGEEMSAGLCKPRAKEAFEGFFQDKTIPLLEAKKMAADLLANEIIYLENYDLYCDTGLSSLDLFHNELELLMNKMQERSMFALRMLSFQQVHKRNQDLLEYFEAHKLVDPKESRKLRQRYQEIQQEWGFFKNKSHYLLEKHGGQLNCQPLKETLSSIRALEETAAGKLLNLCQ